MSAQTGIELDQLAPEPLFVQLFEQLLERIESGSFPVGYRLPSTRSMATSIGAHRNTVVRAYEELQSTGLVESVVGRGTFVRRPEGPSGLQLHARREPIGMSSGVKLAPIGWSGALSLAAKSEALARVAQLPRTAPRPGVRDMVNLTRMHPPANLAPVKDFQRCMDHVLRTRGEAALGYAPPEGLAVLREQIVIDLARLGVPARSEDIVVTSGSQQAIDIVARVLCDPGDDFAVESETYHGAINILTVAGANLVAVASDDDGPSIASLEAGATQASGLYLMPNCHNPTGKTVELQRRKALLVWSHRHGVPLIEDDYGADIELSDEPPPPPMKSMDADVVYISTYSKRLIPALRIGFIVCPPGLRDAVVAMKRAVDLGTSALLQYALAEFLERGYLRTHLRRTIPVYRSRRDALEAAFERFLPSGVTWQPMKRGLVSWIGLPDDVRPDELFIEAQRQGVLVTPGSLNSVVNGRGRSGLRLTICNENEPRLAEGVRRLAKAISVTRKRGVTVNRTTTFGAI